MSIDQNEYNFPNLIFPQGSDVLATIQNQKKYPKKIKPKQTISTKNSCGFC